MVTVPVGAVPQCGQNGWLVVQEHWPVVRPIEWGRRAHVGVAFSNVGIESKRPTGAIAVLLGVTQEAPHYPEEDPVVASAVSGCNSCRFGTAPPPGTAMDRTS